MEEEKNTTLDGVLCEWFLCPREDAMGRLYELLCILDDAGAFKGGVYGPDDVMDNLGEE